MRKSLLGLACLVVLSAGVASGPLDLVVAADRNAGAVKKDQWEPDRYNYIDPHTGRKTGAFIKQDDWESDRWNVYEDEFNRTDTYWEQDDWEDDRWNEKEEP